MNFQCPHCQKMLNVPEQFAGQPMKCPLCNGTFQAPSLPPSAPPAGTGAPTSPETYSQPEPVAPRPESPPPSPGAATEAPRREREKVAPPVGYTHTTSLQLNPRVVPWVAPVCLALVFVLLFFPWVGVYPGGYGVYTQNAWQGLGGWVHTDPVGDDELHLKGEIEGETHADWLMVPYLLLLLGVLGLLIASLLAPQLHGRLPVFLQRLMPWRSGIIGLVALVGFLLLLLQLLSGLSLEKGVQRWVDKQVAGAGREPPNTPEKQQKLEIYRGERLGELNLHRTFWLRLVVLLHVIALIGVALEFWLHRRGARPVPRADLVW